MITLLGVALAAALGAPARYLVDRGLKRRFDTTFPLGTWVINVSGAFALGLLVGLGAAHRVPTWLVTFVGTGFLGAYTTFSTFSADTLRLVEDGETGTAMLNIALSLGVGLLAAATGLGLGLM